MRRIALATCLTAAAFPAAAADFTLHRVLLSAAGIGYFEFGGHIQGNATIGLDVPLSDVDDVLRSLAIFDDQGGIGSIELPGRDNAHQAFSEIPFAQAMLNSPGDMLASLRGEEIAVSGPNAMTGRIVSAVPETLAPPQAAQPAPPPAIRTRITLLTATGLRQFILEDAASIEPTDPVLRSRIAAALDAARQQTAASTRHFTLRATGQGARAISAGYVVPVPLWKASYRLILPASPQEKARVQGWAVLENQSGTDWKSVDLTLHSGNPVTFHQAIYASYYASRPEIPVEILGRILPDADIRTYAGAVEQSAPPPPPAAMDMPPSRFNRRAAPGIIPGAQRDIVFNAAPALAKQAAPAEAAETPLDTTFHIATPIDLAQGHTASVPILDRAMPASQLDWLQPGSTRPVSAIRLTNDGAESLPPGVLTLYSQDPKTGAAFAGDAQLSGLPAGQSRLLGFAEDLRTTATRSAAPGPDAIIRTTLSKATLRRTLTHRMSYTVELTAPAQDPRTILVEFPRNPGATLTIAGATPPGLEHTALAWRVPVTLKPGEVRRLVANEDTQGGTEERFVLDDGTPDETILADLTATGGAAPEIQAKLQPLLALRDALADKQAALKQLTGSQNDANADEDRIRNNLRVVFGPGDLHEKLLAGLDADETTLAALKPRIAEAQQEATAARTNLADLASKLEF